MDKLAPCQGANIWEDWGLVIGHLMEKGADHSDWIQMHTSPKHRGVWGLVKWGSPPTLYGHA